MTVLSPKDKENLVIDLLNKGYKTREIVKLAHVSNTTVIKIRAKLPAEVNEEQQRSDQNKKQLSIPSQAFKLFLEGKPVVRVAIELDLPTDQAIKIYKDYLTLQRMSKIVLILNKHGNSIPAFMTWFEYIEKNNVQPKDIADAIDYIKNMQPLQQQKEDLENEIETLESERDSLLESIESIKNLSHKAY